MWRRPQKPINFQPSRGKKKEFLLSIKRPATKEWGKISDGKCERKQQQWKFISLNLYTHLRMRRVNRKWTHQWSEGTLTKCQKMKSRISLPRRRKKGSQLLCLNGGELAHFLSYKCWLRIGYSMLKFRYVYSKAHCH